MEGKQQGHGKNISLITSSVICLFDFRRKLDTQKDRIQAGRPYVYKKMPNCLSPSIRVNMDG